MRRAVILAGLIAAPLLVRSTQADDAARRLTLEEAIQIALQNSPDLASAQQRLAAARAAIQQADAALFPRIRVSETYSASDNPVQAFMMDLNQRRLSFGPGTDFNNPPTTDNLNAKLLATYSLYNGGRDVAARQAANLNSEAAAQMLESVRNDLVFEVTRVFHTIGKARHFVNTAQAAVTSMQANRTVAQNRFDQGNALKTDLLDAEVRLAEARENLLRAQNAVAISETVFRNLLGVGETRPLTAADADAPVFTNDRQQKRAHPSARAEPGNPAADVSGRPEFVAAQKAVAVAERQVRIAEGGHLPRVHAFASYDLDSGDARRFEDSWVAGVSVELDVFDGFLTRGKVAEARANLGAAREQLRKTELALQLEAKEAQLNLQEAQARLATTEQAVAQAEESLQITKERYGNGLTLLSQLLDAETALTAARQRRAAAEADSLIARAALVRALGRAWKEEK
jgi:outer membrane protein